MRAKTSAEKDAAPVVGRGACSASREIVMEESRIKAVVVRSACPFYSAGDAVYFDGPLLDKEKSGNVCMMALNAIFPFVYAARKGVLKETPVQCPDCEEHVEFLLQAEPRV